MFTNLLVTRIRHLLVTIGALLKRVLCCCSRRRKASTSECEALSSVDVVRDVNSHKYKNIVEKDWNSWDDSPATVEEHIERYREQLAAPPAPREPAPEEQIDFFQDMAPQIVTQQKICIAGEDESGGRPEFSRLTAQIDIPVVDGLADWDEEGAQAGWDDADEGTTKQLIRETKKELRQQQRQQHQRSHYK
ncbi:uncharacterized protein LOC129760538 [Uranotaenia lowii]|uniref:uncharacterized protein LOC129760538 n=1 Tax=Uranotaenia lowii TaxID=190385 RepID=UPI00247898FE|nr:uncharacterized protein LOC129760538 [Uranotaenia lowii]